MPTNFISRAFTGKRRQPEVTGPLGEGVRAYVCGPTLMVEAVVDGLVQTGLAPGQIRTERFGPTGGSS